MSTKHLGLLLMVLLMVLAVLGQSMVFAGEDIVGNEKGPYKDHDYTREIPARFYVDDGISTKFYGDLQVPVFDLPQTNIDSGLSAVRVGDTRKASCHKRE